MSLNPNMDSNTPNRAFSRQDYSWMDRARILAGMSTERQKHGCVIVSGGRLLATGVNVFRNDPRNVDWMAASYHAEWSAISALHSEHLELKLTFYIARVNARYEPMMSKPCEVCAPLTSLVEARYRVVWTTGGYHNE